MPKEKKTLCELANEMDENPARKNEIMQKIKETPEYQKCIAEHYASPVVQAASTHRAFRHKEEDDYTFEAMKIVLEDKNKALRSNNLTCVEEMLMAQAHTLLK